MIAVSRSNFLALGAAFLMSGLCAQDAPQNIQSATPEPLRAALSQQASDATIKLTVAGETVPGEVFLGGILVSLDSGLCHYLTDLPPLLCDHAVLAAGFTTDAFSATVDQSRMPAGMAIYAQGVIASSRGIVASRVMQLEAGAGTRTDG